MVEAHIQNNCPLQPVACPLFKLNMCANCSGTVIRSSLEEHVSGAENIGRTVLNIAENMVNLSATNVTLSAGNASLQQTIQSLTTRLDAVCAHMTTLQQAETQRAVGSEQTNGRQRSVNNRNANSRALALPPAGNYFLNIHDILFVSDSILLLQELI